MDRHFLEGVVDSFLITQEAYKSTRNNYHTVRTIILQDLLEQINILRSDDIEIYDMLCDKTKLFQQRALNTYLIYSYSSDYPSSQENLNEIDISLITLGILGTIAGGLLGTAVIPKMLMKTLGMAGKVFELAGGFLVKHGRYWKFRYAIIQQNAKDCYVKCGLKLDENGKPVDKMNILYYLNTGNSKFPISNKHIDDTTQCLTTCYLVTQMEVIALLFKYYFVCLKSNNAFDKISNISFDDLLKVSSGIELGGTCYDVFEEATKAVQTYYDLLDFIFEKDNKMRLEYTSKLNKRILETKDEIRKTSNFNKFGGNQR